MFVLEESAFILFIFWQIKRNETLQRNNFKNSFQKKRYCFVVMKNNDSCKKNGRWVFVILLNPKNSSYRRGSVVNSHNCRVFPDRRDLDDWQSKQAYRKKTHQKKKFKHACCYFRLLLWQRVKMALAIHAVILTKYFIFMCYALAKLYLQTCPR